MNNFEEWVEDEIASVAWYSFPHAMQRVEGIDRNSLLHLGREENIRELAHAIRNKVLHEAIEEVERIVLVEAVQKFNSTPQIGEPFDVEKHNHANRMLNDMNSFIWKESKQSLLNLLTKE